MLAAPTLRLHTSKMRFLRRFCSPRASRIARCLAVLLLSAAAAARADEVQLQSGAVIEGRATRDGDTVVVRMESGEIRLPADSVQRIKKSQASDDVAQRRRAALAARDIKGRIELASYCREHDLRATERALLEEVIALEPNHAGARRLLGYVRTEHGWVERSAQEQQARDAEREVWLARQRERERDEARARERDLASRQLQLENERLNGRSRYDDVRPRDEVYSYPYGYGYAYAPTYPLRREPIRQTAPAAPAAERCLPGGCAAAPARPQPVSPISGVRDPRDTTWALPGVRNPREWTR